MLSLQSSPSLCRNLLSSPSSLLGSGKSRAGPGAIELDGGIVTVFQSTGRWGRLHSSTVTTRVVKKKDSEQYEIDQDKAREALSRLDQQLESLSKKQVPSPKIRASDIRLDRRNRTAVEDEGVTEISGSFLAYLTTGLLVFTIFYNVLFYAVIKPSIDGPDYVPDVPPISSEAPNN